MSAYLRKNLCSIFRSDLDTSHLFLGTLMSAYLRQFLCSIKRSERDTSHLHIEIQKIWNLDVGLSSSKFVLDISVGLSYLTINSGTWMSAYLRDFLCSIIRSDLDGSRFLKIGSIFSSYTPISQIS